MNDDFEESTVAQSAVAQVPPRVIGRAADEAGARRERGPSVRQPPHSAEAEEHVIACCLLDEGATLERCKDAGLTPASFYTPQNRVLFEACCALKAPTLETLAAELGPRLNEVGGWPYLMQVTDKVPTTAHAGYFISKLREKEVLRSVIREATTAIENAYGFTSGLDEYLADVKARLDSAAGKATKPATTAKPLFSLELAPSSDPSILLGNRYLSRGDGAVLSSSSGMGKSAMAIQLSTLWALGRPAFGIRPHLALRILYVQSEDSEGDMAEVTDSMRHGLKLGEAELDALNQNLLVITDRVNRGHRFLASLRHHIKEHKPDLVILNPLQAFIDGDITESRDLGRFLREGLNALNEPARFAYLLVHHTTKPATGKERSERLWHEVMYDMAGGAEIINWARAILSLRATPTEGEFKLMLAKRGKRAGVTREVEQGAGVRHEPVTTLALRHSSSRLPSGIPMIFWEESEATEEEKPTKTKGRPMKHQFENYRSVFPPKSSEGKTLSHLWMALKDNGPIPRNGLAEILARWKDDGHIEILDADGAPRRYRRAF